LNTLMQAQFETIAYEELPRSPTDLEHEHLTQLAQKYLDNPALKEKLCDRVYTLLYADLRTQRERIGYCSRGRY
jgi:hypothetical protein